VYDPACFGRIKSSFAVTKRTSYQAISVDAWGVVGKKRRRADKSAAVWRKREMRIRELSDRGAGMGGDLAERASKMTDGRGGGRAALKKGER